jgi:hypothetical protein
LNGVFIQQDKIGFGGGDTNLYRYVFNSPTNYTDSNGNFAIPLVPVAAVAVVGIGLWYYGNQLLDKIDALPPDVFDPNNLNKPTTPELSDDFPGTQFIPPAEEPSTLPFPGNQDERKLEDSHTGRSCGINPPDDLFSPYFEANFTPSGSVSMSDVHDVNKITPKTNFGGGNAKTPKTIALGNANIAADITEINAGQSTIIPNGNGDILTSSGRRYGVHPGSNTIFLRSGSPDTVDLTQAEFGIFTNMIKSGGLQGDA